MIKARKEDLILLGLSDENMKRLKAGQPIKFKLSELKLTKDFDDYEVLIYNGRTENTMWAALNQMIEPQN
jgi:hypothetical protein